MVTTGMKRYRQRTDAQAELVGVAGDGIIDTSKAFGRQAPLRLEIGFGHGQFLSQMAAAHPDENFIGVEHQDLRVTKTAHKSHGLGATNVRLYWTDAQHLVRNRLAHGSLHRAYVLFPDPWPKRKHRRRRILNRSFLVDLAWAMAPGGRLIIATDAHDYGFQALNNLSTLSEWWRNRYPNGYSIDIPTRFPTVFEGHKKAAGCSIVYLMAERTAKEPPSRAPWTGVPGSSPVRPQFE